MTNKSDTPRTDAIKTCIRGAIRETNTERQFALEEAAGNGVEQLERELFTARREGYLKGIEDAAKVCEDEATIAGGPLVPLEKYRAAMLRDAILALKGE